MSREATPLYLTRGERVFCVVLLAIGALFDVVEVARVVAWALGK